jgi:hypothetical protein
MPNTLGEMRTEVRGWFDTGTNAEGRLEDWQIDRRVNGVIASLARNADLLFSEFEETITISPESPQTELSSLDNKFSRPFSMWYVTSSGELKRIAYVTPEVFEKKYWGSSDDGEPEHYTIFGHKIYIGPTPDDEYSLTFRFYGFPGDLENPTDTNNFLEYAWDVVLYGTLAQVCLHLLEDNRFQIFKQEFRELERRFKIEHARSKSSGYRVQSHEPGWMED